ncbi:MAG: hypothetical protein K2Z81_26270 [Cyanobacteria bacterium]|nr:hypothetical protein [Cyanobacteriota bacterium]
MLTYTGPSNILLKSVFLCAFLAGLVGLACGADLGGGGAWARFAEPDLRKKPSDQDLPFTTLDKGLNSGINSVERLTIKDENSWISVWKRHTAADVVVPKPPHVDFDKCMVVAIFQGDGDWAGIVEIDRIKRFKDKIVVYTNDNQPNANTTRTKNRSYHIVRTTMANLPVVFR